jgi:hypothetical protein
MTDERKRDNGHVIGEVEPFAREAGRPEVVRRLHRNGDDVE